MDNRIANNIYKQIQAGEHVPNKTKKMLIGFLTSVADRHRHSDKVKQRQVEKIIKELKEQIRESKKPVVQSSNLFQN